MVGHEFLKPDWRVSQKQGLALSHTGIRQLVFGTARKMVSTISCGGVSITS